jgi:septum formation inhibitor MinC
MIQQGARDAENQRRRKRQLEERRAQDYALNVPEVEAKKRSFRNLFQGLSRTAEDRRSESRAQAENMTRRFRRLGDGANARAQERWLEARRRGKIEQQLLAQREQEARQRAYNEQQAAQANLREVGPRAPEDYKLAEDDADILQGVNEQSYDIPNGLVIERTVRTGNLVVRYRKVVTKTGVYYFRGDRSITADTWRRETTIVLD